MALTPDSYRNVSIEIRRNEQEWRETVAIVCVPIAGGLATQVWRTQTEFPEFTVISIDNGRSMIVPLVSVCGRSMDMRQSTPVVTDSATSPTWVEPAAELGFEVHLSATQGSRNSLEAVRSHYRRLRDQTNWGATIGTVQGRLVNVSQRLSGKEFARIERVDFAASVDQIPSGALDGHCIGYGPQGSDTANFRSCAMSVWHPESIRADVPDELRRYCDTFDAVSQCTRTAPDDCARGEQLYRRTAQEEFSHQIGLSLSPDRGTYGCYGVVPRGRGFSLRSLDAPPLFVVLGGDDFRGSRFQRYTE